MPRLLPVGAKGSDALVVCNFYVNPDLGNGNILFIYAVVSESQARFLYTLHMIGEVIANLCGGEWRVPIKAPWRSAIR